MTENAFAVRVAASAPVAPYVFIEAFGLYATADGQTFKTEADVLNYLNHGNIQSKVEDFMAYVDAHPEEFFSLPARKARTKRDGTVLAGAGPRIMAERPMLAAKTRLRGAAALVYGVELRQG